MTIAVALFFLSNMRSACSINLVAPKGGWELAVKTPGFSVTDRETSPDGRSASLQAENTETDINASIFIEPEKAPGGAQSAMEFYQRGLETKPAPRSEIKKYQLGDAWVVEYVLKEFKGIAVNQKNVNVYFCYQSYWIDVHLSKVATPNYDFSPIIRTIGFGYLDVSR